MVLMLTLISTDDTAEGIEMAAVTVMMKVTMVMVTMMITMAKVMAIMMMVAMSQIKVMTVTAGILTTAGVKLLLLAVMIKVSVFTMMMMKVVTLWPSLC